MKIIEIKTLQYHHNQERIGCPQNKLYFSIISKTVEAMIGETPVNPDKSVGESMKGLQALRSRLE